jgi:hypothetical protein
MRVKLLTQRKDKKRSNIKKGIVVVNEMFYQFEIICLTFKAVS